MLLILTGIKMFLLCWIITRFKPIEMILDLLPDRLIFNMIKLLLSCLMCMSFWMTLIFTADIFMASAVGFIGFWYDKILGFYENRIKLN